VKVLVSGHHGYIGSVLTPLIAAAGHDVVGLDTFLFRGCDLGESPRWPHELTRDIRDVQPGELQGFDAIVHLAALSNDPLGDLNPDWTDDINRNGTIQLARSAREAGVERFLFASSCSMYGASGTDELLDENAPLRPLTAYAESKVRAEEELFELADGHFSPVSMRNATAYGASPRLRLDIVLNNLVGWAHAHGSIKLQSDGTAWRPLVHIRDIAQAALALLAAPSDEVTCESFNIGSESQNYRIRELADVVQGRYPACEVTFASGAVSDPRSYRVDFAKLHRRFPGFRCEWSAERGVEELASAYAAGGLTAEVFDGHRFVRLRQLRRLLDGGSLGSALRWAAP
jgi:nucleoside-diphosphate-sugar epimerase